MSEFFRLLRDPIFMVFAIPVCAILCGTLTAIYKMRLTAAHGGEVSKGSKGMSAEDVQTIQELYKGFEKLNERVEALETILLDQAKKRRD